jgi:hypothetical protein
MLVGLVTPVLMQALRKARAAAVKAEIDMLHMAVMNYKNEYGSVPPCLDGNFAAGGPAAKHVARLFPRCPNVPAQFVNAGWVAPLVPANALVAWLTGFTNDPQMPLTGAGPRKVLYDFDKSRFGFVGSAANRVVYFASGNPQSPFIYISPAEYGNRWPPLTSTYVYTVNTTSYTIPSQHYVAEFLDVGAGPIVGQFFNPDSFQILWAGKDGVWGTDDDMSNFWPGTRGEYKASLKK